MFGKLTLNIYQGPFGRPVVLSMSRTRAHMLIIYFVVILFFIQLKTSPYCYADFKRVNNYIFSLVSKIL